MQHTVAPPTPIMNSAASSALNQQSISAIIPKMMDAAIPPQKTIFARVIIFPPMLEKTAELAFLNLSFILFLIVIAADLFPDRAN